MPIYKRCSRCGRRLPPGNRCPCQKERHKEYDRYSRDRKSKQYYSGAEWAAARSAALEADEGFDVYLYMTEGRLAAADTAHHIIPLKDDWERRNDVDNLMSLHHDTHSLIESQYKKAKEKTQVELREMLKKYRKLVRAGGI